MSSKWCNDKWHSKFSEHDSTPQIHNNVINIKDPDADNYNLFLPLSMKGVTSYLQVHKHTKEEWELKT